MTSAKQTFIDLKPWDGVNGTGLQARTVIKQNFDMVNDAIDDIEEELKAKVSGLPIGGIIMWSGSVTDIPAGFNLCDGSTVTGFGVVPDLRSKFIVGFDARDVDYNAIGNKGGEKEHKLIVSEMPKHSHTTDRTSIETGGNLDMEQSNNGPHEKYTSGTGQTGGDQAHENRPPYYVLAFIIKVAAGDGGGGSDGKGITSIEKTNTIGLIDTYTITYTDATTDTFTVANGSNGSNGNNGNGITSIARTSGTGAAGTTDTYTITFTDASTTTFTVVNGSNGTNGTNGSSTEQAEYVLSGLDQEITTGVKVSETVRQDHIISASDIYAEVTIAPTSLDIVFDIQRNGISIFSTLPKITAGTKVIAGTHVLSTTPATFSVGDVRTIIISQIGVGETGQNLVVSLLMNKI